MSTRREVALTDLADKRSAAVSLYTPPAPIGTDVLRAKSKKAVLKLLAKELNRGAIAATHSDVVHVSNRLGGGYAIKVVRLKDAPEPMPMWAKLLVRFGIVLMGLMVTGSLLLFSLSLLVGSLARLPWMSILGFLGLLALLSIATPVGRRCCRVVVEVWH